MRATQGFGVRASEPSKCHAWRITTVECCTAALAADRLVRHLAIKTPPIRSPSGTPVPLATVSAKVRSQSALTARCIWPDSPTPSHASHCAAVVVARQAQTWPGTSPMDPVCSTMDEGATGVAVRLPDRLRHLRHPAVPSSHSKSRDRDQGACGRSFHSLTLGHTRMLTLPSARSSMAKRVEASKNVTGNSVLRGIDRILTRWEACQNAISTVSSMSRRRVEGLSATSRS